MEAREEFLPWGLNPTIRSIPFSPTFPPTVPWTLCVHSEITCWGLEFSEDRNWWQFPESKGRSDSCEGDAALWIWLKYWNGSSDHARGKLKYNTGKFRRREIKVFCIIKEKMFCTKDSVAFLRSLQ